MNRGKTQTQLDNPQLLQQQENIICELKELLVQLNQSVTTNKTVLKETTTQMQKKINQLTTNSYKVPYKMLLIQIYAAKLDQFWKAEKLCNSMMDDTTLKQQVIIEVLLKMAFVHATQKKFKTSLKKLEDAQKIAKIRPQFKAIINQYISRYVETSNDKILLQGLRQSNFGRFQKSIQCFTEYFVMESKDDQKNKENKYFAAKSISHLLETVPDSHELKGISKQKCKEFIQKYESEDHGVTKRDRPDHDKYLDRKRFLNQILKRYTELANQMDGQNLYRYYEIHLKLAELKIKRSLQNKSLKDEQSERIMRFILDQIENKEFKNIYMIVDFVKRQYRGLIKINKFIHSTQKQVLNSSFHTIKQFSNFKKNFPVMPIPKPTIQGSKMVKVNISKNGTDTRYFYKKDQDIKNGIIKLYYCASKDQKNKDNKYYDITGARITYGKTTQALKRAQFADLMDEKCFTIFAKSKQLNFYVPNYDDYIKWRNFFDDKFQIKKKSQKKIKIMQVVDYIPQPSKQKKRRFFG